MKFENFNPYLRHVKIYCKNRNSFLYIKKDKNNKNYVWDVTLINDEITLFLNGYYLDVDEDQENITGCQFMKVWKFKKIKDCYAFIYPNKKINNILSMEGHIFKVNKAKIEKNEIFQLIDIIDEE